MNILLIIVVILSVLALITKIHEDKSQEEIDRLYREGMAAANKHIQYHYQLSQEDKEWMDSPMGPYSNLDHIQIHSKILQEQNDKKQKSQVRRRPSRNNKKSKTRNKKSASGNRKSQKRIRF